jgi:hypothetical protein
MFDVLEAQDTYHAHLPFNLAEHPPKRALPLPRPCNPASHRYTFPRQMLVIFSVSLWAFEMIAQVSGKHEYGDMQL